MKQKILILVSMIAATTLFASPPLAGTMFEIWATTQVRPGDFDPESPGTLLNTRVKGTAHMMALDVDPLDKGRIMTVSGNLGEHSLTSCGGAPDSVGTCSSSVAIAGSGHVVGCGIPLTGLQEGNCDVYYRTQVSGTFFFVTMSGFSGCFTFDCDCT
jgi:hypothetical protein